MYGGEWHEAWAADIPPSDAELDRIATLDLSYDPDQPPPTVGEPIQPRVLLIDPALPDTSDGPDWWAYAASLGPSGHLLDALDQLPFDQLDAEQALQLAVAAEKLSARAQALQLRAVARFAKLRPPTRGEGQSEHAPNLGRYAPDELGLALAVSRQAAGHRLGLACALTDHLPATLGALHAGRIDLGKAQVIAAGTAVLTPDQARTVEQRVLERAGRQTHPQLRAATNRAVIQVDPDAAVERRKTNIEQRSVELLPGQDGVSDLWARLPSEVASACYDRLCTIAAKAKTPDDNRTSDQRRADVFADLLLGTKTGGGVQAHILVLTRETSLLRLDDEPGELIGSGPLPAQVVRKIAEQHPQSIWRRLLTDPASGTVTDLGRTRYRPTAGLDEFVRLRTMICYFPGCRRPATRCDFNHLQPESKGGDTSEANGGPACRHHHPLTDGPEPAWKVHQPTPGIYEITTPTGRKFINDPLPLLAPSARKNHQTTTIRHHSDSGLPQNVVSGTQPRTCSHHVELRLAGRGGCRWPHALRDGSGRSARRE
jgi:hypothetical protein